MEILILDDHHLVLQGLEALLGSMNLIEKVYIASSAKEAFNTLKCENISLVITDLQMPKVSGFDVIEYLKVNYPSIRILVVSMVEDTSKIQKALSLGADGYVLKNEKKEVLEKAIHTVIAGGQFLSSAIMTALLNKTAADSPITSREKEVAIALAQGKSNQEVAESLFLSPQTIATHRKNVYRKLEITNTASLVKYIAEQGWI